MSLAIMPVVPIATGPIIPVVPIIPIAPIVLQESFVMDEYEELAQPLNALKALQSAQPRGD